MRQDYFYEKHRDDRYIDEITVKIVERYKTSGLSGDEWRFSTLVSFYRKGQLLYERTVHTIDDALAWMPWAVKTAYESDDWAYAKDENLCFQPGCREEAVSEYELKELFDRSGMRLDPTDNHFKKRRKFCQKHLLRGDCSREDTDSNYIVISGPGPNGADMTDANITESAQVSVHVDNIEDAPEAIQRVQREWNV